MNIVELMQKLREILGDGASLSVRYGAWPIDGWMFKLSCADKHFEYAVMSNLVLSNPSYICSVLLCGGGGSTRTLTRKRG
jgi:hypothetical protein